MATIELASLSECTGCSACHDVCPKDCILMTRPGDSLHIYPLINRELCIECGKCVRTCPVITSDGNSDDFVQQYYAAWNKSEKQVESSTSGGVGSAISEWGLRHNYIVYGASFDKEWHLSHQGTATFIDSEKFKRSKYLQSDTTGIFTEILYQLRADKKILFIGTPCQIAGLQKVCGVRYRNQLVTVDIICHGVNSPYVWHGYVKYLEGLYNSKLIYYNFRDKSHGWERTSGSPNLRVAMKFANGKEINERAVYNQFHYWFGQHYILREACFNCRYRTKERISDITIGDFWGIDKIIPGIDIKSGVSAVIVNTQMGSSVIDGCDIVKTKVEPIKATNVLKGYIEKRPQSVRENEVSRMKNFTAFFLSNSFELAIKRHKAPTKVSFFFERIKSLLKRL